MKVISKYAIPLTFFLLAHLTLISNPNQPLFTKLPITPGAYQNEVAALFFGIGLLLTVIIYKSKNRDEGR